jgi:hypothetical protein
MTSRLVRLGLVAAVALVLLLIPVLVVARPYLGAVFGLGFGGQGAALTDLRSVADLRSRFDADAGSPRLVLLVSPLELLVESSLMRFKIPILDRLNGLGQIRDCDAPNVLGIRTAVLMADEVGGENLIGNLAVALAPQLL